MATGRTPSTPETPIKHFTKTLRKMIFIALYYSNNFNSTAPFKNAILVPDLAGRQFGDDFEQLVRCKMDQSYVSHSYVSQGALPNGVPG